MSVPQYHDISISSENVTKYSSLRPGDQLAVEGEFCGIKYYHHGIFISHEEGIIDFGGANKQEATVRQVDLLDFTCFGKRRLVRITYPKNQCLPPDVVVKNAKELLQNRNKWGPYDALENNCEHFATKCKTGIAISMQAIEKLRECLENPLQIITYTVIVSAASVGSSSGSLGSGSSGSSGCGSGSFGSFGSCS